MSWKFSSVCPSLYVYPARVPAVEFRRLRSLTSHQCQCEGQLCVLFVSRVPFARLHTLSRRSTLLAPIEIVLPPVRQSEALDYAMQRCDDLLSAVQQAPTEANRRAVRGVLDTAISTFSSETNDLGELRTLSVALFLAGSRRLGPGTLPTAEKLLTHKDLFSGIMADVAPRAITPDTFIRCTTSSQATFDGHTGARPYCTPLLPAYALPYAY